MAPCYFLTWNLGARKDSAAAQAAFELISEHLPTFGTCIAALQEVPEGITLEDVAKGSNGLIRVVEKTVGQKVLLVHSRDVSPSRVFTEPRMVGATFGGALWGGLQVLGVHLNDRGSLPEGQGRGVDASKWQNGF